MFNENGDRLEYVSSSFFIIIIDLPFSFSFRFMYEVQNFQHDDRKKVVVISWNGTIFIQHPITWSDGSMLPDIPTDMISGIFYIYLFRQVVNLILSFYPISFAGFLLTKQKYCPFHMR
jgi:hypothetical protein